MTLTSNTRNQLYTKLKNSHLPENYEKFTKNPEVMTVAKMIVEIFEGFRKQEHGVYQQFCKQMDESQNLPSVFLKNLFHIFSKKRNFYCILKLCMLKYCV